MADARSHANRKSMTQADLERAYREVWPVVWRTAQRYGLPETAAEDVAQEAITRVLLRLQRADTPVVSLPSYAVAVTRNVAIDLLRREHRSRRVPTLQDELDMEAALSQLVATPVDEDEFELREFLQRAISELSEADRLLLAMRLSNGETTGAIAERLGMSSQRVAQRLQRILDRLRQLAEAEGLSP